MDDATIDDTGWGRHGVAFMRLAPGQLRPAPANANVMDEGTYQLLKQAIATVGFLQPILVTPVPGEGDAYVIIDGHHRVRAAEEIGLKRVPCVVREDPSVDTAVALALGMNKLRGELDLRAVAVSVRDLMTTHGWTADQLSLAGLTGGDVRDLIDSLATEALDMDAAPANDNATADDAAPTTWVLEIPFAVKADYNRARRALRKLAGGKDGDLGEALLRALAEDD